METEKQDSVVCPSCIRLKIANPQHLNTDRPALNAVSRYDSSEYICNLCGDAEAVADTWQIPVLDARERIEAGTMSLR